VSYSGEINICTIKYLSLAINVMQLSLTIVLIFNSSQILNPLFKVTKFNISSHDASCGKETLSTLHATGNFTGNLFWIQFFVLFLFFRNI